MRCGLKLYELQGVASFFVLITNENWKEMVRLFFSLLISCQLPSSGVGLLLFFCTFFKKKNLCNRVTKKKKVFIFTTVSGLVKVYVISNA